MKKILYIIIIVFITTTPAFSAEVIGGAITLGENQPDEPIELGGNWKFVWKKHLDPGTDIDQISGAENLDFLTYWQALPQKRLDRHGQGFASYCLEIISPAERGDLGLSLPVFYSSYKLYLNGALIAHNGEPGQQEQNTTPYGKPNVKPIELIKGENNLILHVANFHHHKGGASGNILLGNYTDLVLERNFYTSSLLFVGGAFIIAALFALTLFNFERKEYSFLFFGLFAIAYTYRILGTHSYFIQEVFPELSWFITIRLEHISLYASVIFFAYFYRNLIQQKAPDWMYHTVAGVSGIMILSTFFSVEVFTSVMDYYLAFLALAAASIGIIHLVKMRNFNPMAIFTTISVLALMATMAFKAAVYYNWVADDLWLTFAGYNLFITTQALALGQRLGQNMKREANRSKEAKQTQRHFLNSVSHELRTPMNAILGMSEWLGNTELSKEQKEKVKTIHTNGTQLNTLLLDLLNFSALDSGDMKLDKKKTNIKEVIKKVCEKVKAEYSSKNLAFNIKVEEGIPDEVVADEERLALVLHHLLDNAFKYSDSGEVDFRVRIIERDNKRVQLGFKIIDTGKGISKKELDHVLDAFYQGEQGNTRGYGGTGLGLTVSAQLVELMGGDLWIDSKVDSGTTVQFELTLPMPIMDLAKEKDKAKEGIGELNPDLRMLYAEDNPINQKLLTMMLKSLGYDIDTANNGLEAWEMAISNSYDIIFMDIQMPKMDGIEATRRIIDDVRDRPIIIAVTANAESADQQRCAEAGINDFISKPFNVKVLKQHLIKWQGLSNYMAESKKDDVQRLIS